MMAGSEAFRDIILSNMSSRMQIMAKEEIVNLVKNWNSTYPSKISEAILDGYVVLNQITG